MFCGTTCSIGSTNKGRHESVVLFVYRFMQRLMLRLFEESQHSHQDASFDPELHELLKV